MGQPVRLTRCRTPGRSPISRGFAPVDAMKRPCNRSPARLRPALAALAAPIQPLEGRGLLRSDRANVFMLTIGVNR
jgi:hypothetical protein